jgi:hypothetical protein
MDRSGTSTTKSRTKTAIAPGSGSRNAGKERRASVATSASGAPARGASNGAATAQGRNTAALLEPISASAGSSPPGNRIHAARETSPSPPAPAATSAARTAGRGVKRAVASAATSSTVTPVGAPAVPVDSSSPRTASPAWTNGTGSFRATCTPVQDPEIAF